MKNPLRSSFFKYFVLPIGLMWGGLKAAYSGPEAYDNPTMDPGIARIQECGYGSLDSWEKDAIKKHPDNSYIITKGNIVNLTNMVALAKIAEAQTAQERSLDSLEKVASPYAITDLEKEERLRQPVYDQIVPYYPKKILLDYPTYHSKLQFFKLPLKIADVEKLQHFSDSIADVRHVPRPDLFLKFEESNDFWEGMSHEYNQAYSVMAGDTAIIALSSCVFQNYNLEELKATIGHEWGHILLGHCKMSNKNVANEILRTEEDAANSMSVVLTRNPKACINQFGKNRICADRTTLLGEFFNSFTAGDHPTDLNRANHFAELAKKMGLHY